MRRRISKSLVMCLVLGPCCAIASADGGRVVFVERHGDYQISVFASPDPLRAGPVDVSVLLQDAASDAPIADAKIDMILSPRDERGPTMRTVATSAAATNKLLQAALFDVPTAGIWDAELSIAGDHGPAKAHFTIEVGPPLPRWLTVWPWFSWPVGAVFLFAMHRRMVWQKQRATSPQPQLS